MVCHRGLVVADRQTHRFVNARFRNLSLVPDSKRS